MRQILINIEPYEKRVIIVNNGLLEEFQVERNDQQRLAGNIYKGIIESIVPGIGAIFVNIGTAKNGFLYFKNIEEESIQSLIDEEIVIEKKSSKNKDLLSRLKKGQEIIVQVVKEPIGTKWPLLTTDISLPGKYLVLMPFNNTIGISKRIDSHKERARLKHILEEINMPDNVGCIARTESIGTEARELKLEFKYLSNLWSRIRYRSDKHKAPYILYEEYDLPLRIVRDYPDKTVDKILIDSKEEYKKIYRFVNSIQPSLKKKIFYYRGKRPLYEKDNLESQIEEIFRRKIFLKNGGSIIIEQTEGLVAIDVNTGKFTGRKDPEDTAFKTNTEAAIEIARQVMLRDIGGIVVIDFIDMAEKSHRRRVYETLENAFRRDKAKINIMPISPIGVVEMTRQRIRKNLESLAFHECPYCNGMGRIKTPATISIEALRRLEHVLKERRARQINLIAHPDVGDYIETSFAHVMNSLEKKFRKKVIIKKDSKLHVENVYFE